MDATSSQYRWGLRLSSVISALGILAPTVVTKMIFVGIVFANVLVLVLVTLPATRQAVASERVRVAA